MRVLPPLVTTGDFSITPAMLTSSGAAEPGTGEVAWNSATAYQVGDKCYLAATHLRYQARTAHTNKDPALATVDTASTDWRVIGATNRYLMFDSIRSTGTVLASGQPVVITPGTRINALGFAGLANVARLDVLYERDGEIVYGNADLDGPLEVDLVGRNTGGSFYRWGLTPFFYKRQFALWDLPPYLDGVLTITAHAPGGTGDCVIGDCLLGMQEYIGRAQTPGAQNDSNNFSEITRAFDSTATLKRRRQVPINTVSVVVEKVDVDRVLELKERLDCIPAIYSAIDDNAHGYHGAFFRKGIWRKWPIAPQNDQRAHADMEIEEI